MQASQAMPFLVILPQLFGLIPPFIVFVGCVLYLRRSRGIEAVLMIAGSGLGILMHLVSTACVFLMVSQRFQPQAYGKIATGIHLVAILAALAFAAGFVMMAMKKQPAT